MPRTKPRSPLNTSTRGLTLAALPVIALYGLVPFDAAAQSLQLQLKVAQAPDAAPAPGDQPGEAKERPDGKRGERRGPGGNRGAQPPGEGNNGKRGAPPQRQAQPPAAEAPAPSAQGSGQPGRGVAGQQQDRGQRGRWGGDGSRGAPSSPAQPAGQPPVQQGAPKAPPAAVPPPQGRQAQPQATPQGQGASPPGTYRMQGEPGPQRDADRKPQPTPPQGPGALPPGTYQMPGQPGPRRDADRQQQPTPPQGQGASPPGGRWMPGQQPAARGNADRAQDKSGPRTQPAQQPARPGQPPQQRAQPWQPPGPAGAPGRGPRRDAGAPFSIDQLKKARRQRVEDGGRTVIEEPGNRTIIQEKGGPARIRHDETERLRRTTRDLRSEKRSDGGNLTIAVRPGGVEVFSEFDSSGRLMRRYRRGRDGRETVLIDNRRFRRAAPARIDLGPLSLRMPRERYIVNYDRASDDDIYDALMAGPVERLPRGYSLDEVRYNTYLRDRMRRIDLDTVNFDFGAWEVHPDQYNRLARIANVINRVLDRRPDEVFLIEGHTDAVGSEIDNLTLSDRRAEEVAIILTDTFGVPPENLVTQGYGEEFLKIPTQQAERENRRVAVRRITPLLARD